MIRKLSNLVAPVSVLGKIIHDTWRWEVNVEFMNLGEIRGDVLFNEEKVGETLAILGW